MPLRTYSSGMLMRLAFAITTEVEPDVILMDEWISVGDAKFMEQAKERLEGFISTSSIMVLASHSEDLIRSTCNKTILLGQGEILAKEVLKKFIITIIFLGQAHSLTKTNTYLSTQTSRHLCQSLGWRRGCILFVSIFEGEVPWLRHKSWSIW